MSNIEEDIYNVKELIQGSKLYGEYDGNKYFKSIENILAEREQDKKRIKELEEENHLQRKQIMSAYDKGWILKQKVKDVLDRLHISDIEPWSIYKVSGDVLFDLKELLEDK